LSRRRAHRRRVDQRGQATIELACAIPVVVVVVLVVVQGAVLLLDQLAVTQAAREGARAAAVEPRRAGAVAVEAARRSTRLRPSNLRVTTRGGPGGMVTVEVSYPWVVRMPVTGAELFAADLHGRTSMYSEWVE
jgi:hypothetical protein